MRFGMANIKRHYNFVSHGDLYTLIFDFMSVYNEYTCVVFSVTGALLLIVFLRSVRYLAYTNIHKYNSSAFWQLCTWKDFPLLLLVCTFHSVNKTKRYSENVLVFVWGQKKKRKKKRTQYGFNKFLSHWKYNIGTNQTVIKINIKHNFTIYWSHLNAIRHILTHSLNIRYICQQMLCGFVILNLIFHGSKLSNIQL